MKITPKFTFASGSFDTDEVKMLCLPSDNHGKVDLCIKDKDCGWNIPIGGVKLHDKDLYVDFKATLEDATKLGDEIARRWNEFNSRTNINSVWHDLKECPERKRKYLAQCKNDRFNVISDSMDWDNFYKKAEIIRWAYIEDLMPKGGKE